MKVPTYSILYLLSLQICACFSAEQQINDEKITSYHFLKEIDVFPEPYRQELIDFCVEKKLALKNPIQRHEESDDIIPLAREVEILQKKNKIREKEIIHRRQELHKIEKGNAILQKKITAIETQKKKIDIPKSKPKVTKNTQNSLQKKNSDTHEPFSLKNNMTCYKLLKEKYKVREKTFLFEILSYQANIAYQAKSTDFHESSHLWRNPINKKYKFVYWACMKDLRFFFAEEPITLPESFGCNENCRYFPKQNNSSSSDTPSDTKSDSGSHTSESDSHSSEEDSSEEHKDVFVSKEEMEAIGN